MTKLLKQDYFLCNPAELAVKWNTNDDIVIKTQPIKQNIT
jgi:hypothetical protein